MHRNLAYFICLLLTACGGAQIVKSDPVRLRTEIAKKDIELVSYKNNPINIFTPSQAGGLGWASVIIAETTMSPKSNGSDSTLQAEKIGLELMSLLKNAMGIRTVGESVLPGPVPDDVKTYQEKALTPYVMEVSILSHGFAYRPTAWTTYQYSMHGQIRLIRIVDATVIWAEDCAVNSLGGDRNLQVEKDEFSDGGKRTEIVYKTAARMCAQQLMASLSKK